MDPSSVGTCAQIARQDVNRKKDDNHGNTRDQPSASNESDGRRTFELVDLRMEKDKRGWRKIVRNFTPSYVIFSHINQFCKERHRVEIFVTLATFPLLSSTVLIHLFLSWFSVIMGTGIVSILLHNLPYNGTWLKYISIIIFVLNIFLFCTFTAISLLRYTLYPQIWKAMILHPSQSLFLGAFPMGLATIVNMIVFVCVPAWGVWVVYLVSLAYLANFRWLGGRISQS